VSSSRRPISGPAVRSRRSAVSPASGSAAAVVAGTASGSTASEEVGTAASCAHPACGGWPTTVRPSAGPDPSAAARTTTPATSFPGRHPVRGRSSWNVSPRLTENAETRTSASSAAGRGSGTSSTTTDCCAFPVATSAFMTLPPD
jgi:hypothetical protein